MKLGLIGPRKKKAGDVERVVDGVASGSWWSLVVIRLGLRLAMGERFPAPDS
jgi:hypothetical protein